MDRVFVRLGEGARREPPRLRRSGLVASGAPIGLLMRHLVHDAATWELYEGLLEALMRHSAVRCPRVRSVIRLRGN